MTLVHSDANLRPKGLSMSRQIRAITNDEKLARGQSIIMTAEQMLLEHGLTAFSMNKLAGECGIAKGTLYLYFKSREEIFAAIYQRKFLGWVTTYVAALSNISDLKSAGAEYSQTLTQTPLLLLLSFEAPRLIEQNVPLETYIEIKRSVADGMEDMANALRVSLGISDERASALIWSFHTAALGAYVMAIKPKFEREAIPQDIRNLSFGLNFDALFMNSISLLCE